MSHRDFFPAPETADPQMISPGLEFASKLDTYMGMSPVLRQACAHQLFRLRLCAGGDPIYGVYNDKKGTAVLSDGSRLRQQNAALTLACSEKLTSIDPEQEVTTAAGTFKHTHNHDATRQLHFPTPRDADDLFNVTGPGTYLTFPVK